MYKPTLPANQEQPSSVPPGALTTQPSPGSSTASGAPGRQLLTHSRLSCFRSCPRKHYLRYELGLRPAETGYALRVGSAFHAALEAADKGLDPGEAIGQRLEDPYDLALVAAMFDAHQRQYADQQLAPVASEQRFEMPLVNPETGRPTPIWRLAGVADRIVQLPDGRLALMEYKTTSRDFSPGAEYWLRLRMDQQLSIYVLAARELGYDVQTILYDVTRRPGLRPYKATAPEKRQYKKDGTLYASQRAEDETPEEFAKRVAEDIAFRPDYYFARIEIARIEQDLNSCSLELWQQQLAIRAAQNSGHFYRNPGACFQPFPCEYLSVCQNDDLHERTPSGFVRSDNIHPELSNATEA